MPGARDPRGRFHAAYRRALVRYGGDPGVCGVDIGFLPDVRGRPRVRVRIHRVDGSLHLPGNGPVRSRPRPANQTTALRYRATGCYSTDGNLRGARVSVLQPGICVGHRGTPEATGTLGAIVYDTRGRPGILSNWHVLAGDQGASDKDPIVQPGDLCRDPRKRIIARLDLRRSFRGLAGDAAVAFLLDGIESKREQLGSEVLLRGARRARLGDELEKSGSKTAITRGRVDGQGRYFVVFDEERVAIDGFRIVPREPGEVIAYGGDSGAVWYDPETSLGVGLHFAGGAGDTGAVLACHLPVVLSKLQVRLAPPRAKGRRRKGAARVPDRAPLSASRPVPRAVSGRAPFP